MTVRSEFFVAYPIDRVVLAVQDVFEQFEWPVLELTGTRIVVRTPKFSVIQVANLPKMTVDLRESGQGTDIAVTVAPALGGGKIHATEWIGRFTNSLSLRIQTQSLSINPTVAIGQGQGEGLDSTGPQTSRTRVQELKDLKDLLDSGALTRDEFEAEKARVLRSD